VIEIFIGTNEKLIYLYGLKTYLSLFLFQPSLLFFFFYENSEGMEKKSKFTKHDDKNKVKQDVIIGITLYYFLL